MIRQITEIIYTHKHMKHSTLWKIEDARMNNDFLFWLSLLFIVFFVGVMTFFATIIIVDKRAIVCDRYVDGLVQYVPVECYEYFGLK